MAKRTFTLQEAQSLLPVLESLLRNSMQGKQEAEDIEREFQAVAHRIQGAGGMLLDIRQLATRRAQRDKAAQRVKDALAEMDAMGVQVKDLDIGLLDFPCMVGDRLILLCWKLGEKTIGFWHDTEEGFRGRKPIDQSILDAQKRSEA